MIVIAGVVGGFVLVSGIALLVYLWWAFNRRTDDE